MNYAIASVSDKTNIVSFSRFLVSYQYQILSSSGTSDLLNKYDIETTKISDFTGFPEILKGRVKTLHPKIYGGILNIRANALDRDDMKTHNLSNINIVVVNLYPFIEKPSIENIDIGGVALIRAAAKNYDDVLVVVDPSDYEQVMTNFEKLMHPENKAARKLFAQRAFHHIVEYDIAIANFFDGEGTKYRIYRHQDKLKYGCNPHQNNASIYRVVPNTFPFEILNGIPGYINYLDAIYSWGLVNEIESTLNVVAAASFKHNAPAGVGTAVPLSPILEKIYDVEDKNLNPLSTAFIRARNSDPLSSFGDFIALSGDVDVETAKLIRREVSDGIIASGYSPEALEILKAKKGGKYIIIQGNKYYTNIKHQDYREINGVCLSQKYNEATTTTAHLSNILTEKKELPEYAQRDLILANITLKYTPSNSVAYAYGGQVVGIGAGQQSRIDCVKLAGKKVQNWVLRQSPRVLDLYDLFKSGIKRQDKINCIMAFINADFNKIEYRNFQKQFVETIITFKPLEREVYIAKILSQFSISLASDAFFPFRDNIDECSKHGVKYIIQPGGSIMDKEIIHACNDYGIVMVCSGVRVFTH